VKLEERSALDWRFADRNPRDKSSRPGSRGAASPYTACKGQGQDRPCRARPADRSLVAEDRSAAGVRDPTGPEELPRRIRGLPTRRWSPRTGLTLWTSWEPLPPRARWSFSSAVPPACHKQRSPAVSSGQSRSLETTVALGSGSLTWGGGGGRNCMACKGSSRGIEKTWVYGGLRVADGQAVTLTAPSRNSANYQRFLALVERTIPGRRDRGGDRQTCPAIPASPRASGWPSIHGSDRCLSPRAPAG
jgi:hypothetical protein